MGLFRQLAFTFITQIYQNESITLVYKLKTQIKFEYFCSYTKQIPETVSKNEYSFLNIIKKT